MTSHGFAGNARYLILPAALLSVRAGTGASWLACAVLGRRAAGRRAAVALAVLAAAGFAAPSLHQVAPRVESLSYDARLNDGLEVAVLRAGGPRRLLACGGLYTGRYQVPVVAWHLGVHLSRVHFEPHAPATVFRSRNSLRDAPQPPLDALGGEAGVTTLAIAGGWRVLQTCDAAG